MTWQNEEGHDKNCRGYSTYQLYQPMNHNSEPDRRVRRSVNVFSVFPPSHVWRSVNVWWNWRPKRPVVFFSPGHRNLRSSCWSHSSCLKDTPIVKESKSFHKSDMNLLGCSHTTWGHVSQSWRIAFLSQAGPWFSSLVWNEIQFWPRRENHLHIFAYFRLFPISPNW